MIREARVKVGLSIGAHHMRRFLLTDNFRLDRKRILFQHVFDYPSLVIARLAGELWRTSVRNYFSRSRHSVFSHFHTQSGYATEFIGCATPEKQIQTLLQS